MWLLTTARARLDFFPRPEDVPNGYAILSHTWMQPGEGEEDTFQIVQRLNEEAHRQFALDALPTQIGRKTTPRIPKSAKQPISTMNVVSVRRSASADNLVGTDDPTKLSTPQPGGSAFAIPGGRDPSAASFRTTPTWHNPRDGLTPKVRAFLERAEKAGFDYAWVDTCCINKESSAELTEAINSMFRYYALSEVCYVYLSDVHTAGVKLSGPISDPDTSEDLARAFERSRWHTRGWTLQELIASRVVVFFSRQWTLLGTKHELSGLLKNITGIPAVILSLRVSFTDKSIAARMSWAAKRVTTRPEDRAYCLFGLFGVNMPTLYGEGDNAFIRLLEEIMKTSRDPTLFLWGSARDVQSLDGLVSDLREADTHARHILPSTPKEFDGCGRIGYSDHAVFRTSGSMDEALQTKSTFRGPTFSLSPDGIQLSAPMLALDDARTFLLIDLSCTKGVEPRYIILQKLLDTSAGSLPLYHPVETHVVRMFKGFQELAATRWVMSSVCVVARPPYVTDPSAHHHEEMVELKHFVEAITAASPFHLSFRDFRALSTALDDDLSPPSFSQRASTIPRPVPWPFTSLVLYFKLQASDKSVLLISLGTCRDSHLHQTSSDTARPHPHPHLSPTSPSLDSPSSPTPATGPSGTDGPQAHFCVLRWYDTMDGALADGAAHSCGADHVKAQDARRIERECGGWRYVVCLTFMRSPFSLRGETLQVRLRVSKHSLSVST